MANMTRAQFVTELQARGWSRFTAAELQKYLDWALQDLYGKAKYDRSVKTVTTVNDTVLDVHAFSSLSGGSDEAIHDISSVYVQQTGVDPVKLEPASDEDFEDWLWPNSLTANPDLGVPTMYYVYDLKLYLYPKPNVALDVHVHHMLREDTFSGDGDTTSLPERFDKAIIMLAEIHCNRRAHNVEELAVAQSTFETFLMEELGMAGRTMAERTDRVQPWRA